MLRSAKQSIRINQGRITKEGKAGIVQAYVYIELEPVVA
jgi:hypothetical protein